MQTCCRSRVTTATVVAFLLAGATPSWPAELPEPKNGDACTFTETFLSKDEGFVTYRRFDGVIVRRLKSGELQGVNHARLYANHGTADNDHPSALTSTDRHGKFDLYLSLWFSDTMWCRNGVVVTDRYVETKSATAKARNCQDLAIELGPTFSGHTWEMSCE